jgi:hypothetical protein
MPGQDGTGPMGRGRLTGRGLGPCGSGFARGRGFGMGFGRGFGRGRRMFAPAAPAAMPVQYGYSAPVELTREEQAKILEAEKTELEAELKQISQEIKQLKEKK